MPPALMFLLKNALTVWSLLLFYTDFRIFFSISIKIWDFDRDCLEENNVLEIYYTIL